MGARGQCPELGGLGLEGWAQARLLLQAGELPVPGVGESRCLRQPRGPPSSCPRGVPEHRAWAGPSRPAAHLEPWPSALSRRLSWTCSTARGPVAAARTPGHADPSQKPVVRDEARHGWAGARALSVCALWVRLAAPPFSPHPGPSCARAHLPAWSLLGAPSSRTGAGPQAPAGPPAARPAASLRAPSRAGRPRAVLPGCRSWPRPPRCGSSASGQPCRLAPWGGAQPAGCRCWPARSPQAPRGQRPSSEDTGPSRPS